MKERVEIMNNKIKKSQLVFDPKMARKLLKLNSTFKFCPFCGQELEALCECHKNLVVDIKPYRNEDNVIIPDRSVLVFENNMSFQADYNQMIEERTKKEAEEFEQLSIDL